MKGTDPFQVLMMLIGICGVVSVGIALNEVYKIF